MSISLGRSHTIPRSCAICAVTRVTNLHKVCTACKAKWGAQLEEPWAIELIALADQEHQSNRRHRRWDQTIETAEEQSSDYFSRNAPYLTRPTRQPGKGRW